jgi:hypothetical protein
MVKYLCSEEKTQINVKSKQTKLKRTKEILEKKQLIER